MAVAQPFRGTEIWNYLPPIATTYFGFAAPLLYMTATMLRSGFLNATASHSPTSVPKSDAAVLVYRP